MDPVEVLPDALGRKDTQDVQLSGRLWGTLCILVVCSEVAL